VSARQMPIVILIVCTVTAACFATTTEVYFTHPYGGIHKIDVSGAVSAVLPNIGRCTGLESDGQGNLFFGRFTQDLHRIDLMVMTQDLRVTDLGRIIDVGAVTHSVDIDIAVSKAYEVYFSHPDGGVRKMNAAGTIDTLLPYVGEVVSLELWHDDSLYFSRYYDDRHKCDLLVASPEQPLANWGDIIEVTTVLLAFDIDLAINTAGDVYFTHPYGGIYMRTTGGQIRTVLPDVGRCTGLAFDGAENLYFGMFYDDRHKIDLMKMTPQGQVTNLGNIVRLGPVELRWHGDIAVVPEPAGISLLALGGLALLKTRRFH